MRTFTVTSTLHKLTKSQYRSMAWTNGRGSTTELLVVPKNGKLNNGSADWRVSMAEVPESGQFSLLPGYDRIIGMVKGDGFHLCGDMGTDISITNDVIHSFSGEENIQCDLIGGPCVDLNLIYKKNKYIGSINLVGNIDPIYASITTQSSSETIMIICLGGQVMAKAWGKTIAHLDPFDSVLFSSINEQAGLFLHLKKNSRVAVIGVEEIIIN